LKSSGGFVCLRYENSLDPSFERRAAASMLSKGAVRMINPAEAIRDRAKEFEKINIKSRDALHLACAESIGCAYFITCDDKFLKKARQLGLTLNLMNPIEFVNLEEQRNGTSQRF
jgi:predicted nucleic acid-binding protein